MGWQGSMSAIGVVPLVSGWRGWGKLPPPPVLSAPQSLQGSHLDGRHQDLITQRVQWK